MKTEIDCPSADETHVRATAWALGQLTPEETTAFEAEMAANPGLAAYAEEMRQFSHLLATEFPTDESGQLPKASRSQPPGISPRGIAESPAACAGRCSLAVTTESHKS